MITSSVISAANAHTFSNSSSTVEVCPSSIIGILMVTNAPLSPLFIGDPSAVRTPIGCLAVRRHEIGIRDVLINNSALLPVSIRTLARTCSGPKSITIGTNSSEIRPTNVSDSSRETPKIGSALSKAGIF